MTRYIQNALIGFLISWPIAEAIAWAEGWSWPVACSYAALLSFSVCMLVYIWRRNT